MRVDSIRATLTALLTGLLLGTVGTAQAQQGASMEERLRNQLRATTTQLQEAQNELAVLKAGRPGAPGPLQEPAADTGKLRQEIAELKAQLAAERQARKEDVVSRQQFQAESGRAREQAGQLRTAYDGLLKIARAAEAERQRLAAQDERQRQALSQCTARNARLYEVGQEILQAYEGMDVGTLMSVRQPFAAQSRVKYEQIAQDYGDKLYEGRFDERSVTPSPAGSASGAAPQGAAQQ
jgi:colicin import membrane protein